MRELDQDAVPHRPARVDLVLQPDVWCEPHYVVEVQADEITRSLLHAAGRDGEPTGYALRFPRMVGWIRTDKRPEDATTVERSSRCSASSGCGQPQPRRLNPTRHPPAHAGARDGYVRQRPASSSVAIEPRKSASSSSRAVGAVSGSSTQVLFRRALAEGKEDLQVLARWQPWPAPYPG